MGVRIEDSKQVRKVDKTLCELLGLCSVANQAGFTEIGELQCINLWHFGGDPTGSRWKGIMLSVTVPFCYHFYN